MSIGLLFWICFVLALLVGFGALDRSRPYWFGYPLLLLVMLFLIGWRIFGFPVHG